MRQYLNHENGTRFIAFQRQDYQETFKSHVPEEILQGDCIYFLIKNPEIGQKIQVYVGETSNIRSRIRDHSRKHFWEYAVVFSCSNFQKWGGESARKYMEAYLIRHLINLNKCVLMNYQIEDEERQYDKYGKEITQIWRHTFYKGAFAFMFYELKLQFLFDNEWIVYLSHGVDINNLHEDMRFVITDARIAEQTRQEQAREAEKIVRIMLCVLALIIIFIGVLGSFPGIILYIILFLMGFIGIVSIVTALLVPLNPGKFFLTNFQKLSGKSPDS
jgi:hypothetical protein